MSKRETFLTSLVCLLIGIVVGFWLSPVKRGLCFGKNAENSFGAGDDYDEYFDDCYDDDEDDMPF